ncbi:hypothetical protein CONPUDRAFT_166728 [Coniophora puteana RWD-64-598 SS2]|uniref:F-box domain-containing protein n=1 Tax=Coniophora puteana (strain RWD-64-598) TaxID=741705 RepID=A0A5M3MIS7_CONPW|nr:uncharacterized protein CONPUDRAFT_166728 [Coniophora puteana RWD-64-598 SS2]EIW78830.1 hypothetical protein CONPUDRAFT_166728 [Coniophora puteana RWD-64-598 SS2]
MDYLNNVPAEVWDSISDQLYDPGDLRNFVRVCRAFWARRHRTLLGVITWDGFPQQSNDIKFLQDHPTMSAYPRSLTVNARISGYHVRQEDHEPIDWEDWFARVHPPLAGHSDSIRPRTSEMPGPCGSFIHLCVEWRVLHTMHPFIALQRLTFHGLQLTAADLTITLHFPNIRRLEATTCQFLPNNADSFDDGVCSHSLPFLLRLPITHLTLLDLEGPLTDDGILLAENELNKVAALAACPTLQHLRFDVSSRVACVVKGSHYPPSPLAMTLNPPAGLLTVEALLPRKDTYERETETRHEYRNLEVVSRDLSSFVSQCTALDSLTIHGYMPVGSFCVAPPDSLLNLEVLRGPEAVLRAINPKNSSLRVLDVYEGLSTAQSIVRWLEEQGNMAKADNNRLCVEEFRVYTDRWDEEVVGVSQAHFGKSLRTLDVRYRLGGPDEDALLSLGPRLLVDFPALERVYFYRVLLPRPKKTPRRYWRTIPVEHIEEQSSYAYGEVQGGVEVDMRDESKGCIPLNTDVDAEGDEMEGVVVRFWGKNCPRLREIGLRLGVVWRREGEKGVWRRARYRFEGSKRVFDTEGQA